jgi:survival of motor neuron-related-splicing factor 30
MIELLEEQLAEQKSKPTSNPKPQHPSKSSLDATPFAHSFKTNDNVLARRKGKGLVSARIISTTGGASDPIYHVRYLDDHDTAKLHHHDLKPAVKHHVEKPDSDLKKRKWEDQDDIPPLVNPAKAENIASFSVTAPGVTNNSNAVISAPAIINKEFAEKAQRDNSAPQSKNRRPDRKVDNKRIMEKKKNAWQEFQKKNPMANKVSQFKTGEGLNARVGFVGSGKGMTKERKRERPIFNTDEDDE